MPIAFKIDKDDDYMNLHYGDEGTSPVSRIVKSISYHESRDSKGTFETGQVNLHVANADQADLAIKQLAAAGMHGFKAESYGRSHHHAVIIDTARNEEKPRSLLARVAVALSRPLDEQGIAVLDARLAWEILDREMKETGTLPSSVMPLTITTYRMDAGRARMMALETPPEWLNAAIDLPGSPIMKLVEDGVPAALRDGKHDYVNQSVTNIHYNGQPDAICEALIKDGIKVTNKPSRNNTGSKEVIIAAEPADVVAPALAKAGLLPESVAAEIAATAKAVHPQSAGINVVFEAQQEASWGEKARQKKTDRGSSLPAK